MSTCVAKRNLLSATSSELQELLRQEYLWPGQRLKRCTFVTLLLHCALNTCPLISLTEVLWAGGFSPFIEEVMETEVTWPGTHSCQEFLLILEPSSCPECRLPIWKDIRVEKDGGARMQGLGQPPPLHLTVSPTAHP